MKIIFALVILSIICAGTFGDVSHILPHETTPKPGPPSPYVFSYEAGRAPGHVDRQHSEVSDGSGVVRGAFSYIDPRNELRTVQYIADENGFHPELSHQVEDSEAVKRAKQKHFELYHRIAEEHAQGQQVELEDEPPQQSEAVLLATKKHQEAFDRIAAEHVAIGAQQEAEREALAAASEHGEIEDGQYHP